MLSPLSAAKWDIVSAAHLLNRAGFGGTPDDIKRLADLGPDKAVSYLIDFEKIPDPTPDPEWAKPDPTRAERRLALRAAGPEERRQLQRQEQQRQRERMAELRLWWLQRMAKGPRPFQEKLTLFWHGHFATSAEKVREAYYMWLQNDLFRRKGSGNWVELLIEAGKDPAMLIWLDQAQSRRQRPNENFAREIMELFALGEGHYTENDVTEAARALTGWSLDQDAQKFVNRPAFHDPGTKTVLGRTGNLNGDDVVWQIVEQPQAALFITAKLWDFFAGEPPSEQLNKALAHVFRSNGNEFRPLLKVLFRSQEFYAPALIRQQVKSPVQWLVGSVRMLECDLPPQSPGLIRGLGQDLLAPPNVKGWDGGFAWISTNTLLARYNQTAALVQPDSTANRPAARARAAQARRPQNAPPRGRPGGVDVEKILTEEERSDKELLLAALEKRLLQARLNPKQRDAVSEFLRGKTALNESDILAAIRMVMSTPEYQLT